MHSISRVTNAPLSGAMSALDMLDLQVSGYDNRKYPREPPGHLHLHTTVHAEYPPEYSCCCLPATDLVSFTVVSIQRPSS